MSGRHHWFLMAYLECCWVAGTVGEMKPLLGQEVTSRPFPLTPPPFLSLSLLVSLVTSPAISPADKGWMPLGTEEFISIENKWFWIGSVGKCCQALCCCEHGLWASDHHVHSRVPGHRPGPTPVSFWKAEMFGFHSQFLCPFYFPADAGLLWN